MRNYLPIRERRRRVESDYQMSVAFFAFIIGGVVLFLALNLALGFVR